jgi:hypothetical protein
MALRSRFAAPSSGAEPLSSAGRTIREILITANAEVLLTPRGTDIDSSTAPVWNSASPVDCLNCGWAGTVGDLLNVVMKKEPGSERVDEAVRKKITNFRDSN